MVTYTKRQKRKKEDIERLRGERDISSSLLILAMKNFNLKDSGRKKKQDAS